MTEFRTYDKREGVGRKMLWPERITLPMAEGTTARLDKVKAEDETRVDVIREAIDRELKRRERKAERD